MRTIYSIHPAIGIARVGDSGYTEEHGWDGSPASYFIGPESPGGQFIPQSYTHDSSGDSYGKYRGEDNKIRRQAARFRIYKKQIDENGEVISAQEIITSDATITWKVSLANRKAIAERFPPYHKKLLNALEGKDFKDGSGTYPNMVMRNFEVAEDQRKKKLIIKDEAQIEATTSGSKALRGEFFGSPVKLADLMIDESGRLIVLGGHGFSKSPDGTPNGEAPEWPHLLDTVLDNNNLCSSTDDDTFCDLRLLGGRHRLYNWDGWCDDTSDGKISATVVLNGESVPISVEDAWVVVAPPDYAAAAKSPVTLYDLAYSTIRKARERQGLPVPPLAVSFTRDVYPILRRTVDLQYVSDRARLGHSGDAAGNFDLEEVMARLASKSPDDLTKKVMILDRLTRPGAVGDQSDMPDLFGGVDPNNPETSPPMEAMKNRELERRDTFGVPLTMTGYQFEVLHAWANNEFIGDWPGQSPMYPDLDAIEPAKQPLALDEAALEQCNGGSFHPGIEASFITGRQDTYRIEADSWFRLASKIAPGMLTENLAVPWQHDFAACSELWWPGQRPVSVPRRANDGSTEFVEWFSTEPNSAEHLFDLLRKSGFVRFHPDEEDKEKAVYLDDIDKALLKALFETFDRDTSELSIEASELRELLYRMRFEDGSFFGAR